MAAIEKKAGLSTLPIAGPAFLLDDDITETINLIDVFPGRAAAMRQQLARFMESCKASHFAADYPGPYTPVNAFQEATGTWA